MKHKHYLILILFFLLAACAPEEPLYLISREEAIPDEAVKINPQDDLFPPIVHDAAWQQPVPMPGPVNTRGGEDSPFITPDGQSFFFFFTPAVQVPAQEQLTDGATGIYWSQRSASGWTEPERIVLNDDLALDGCPYAARDVLWFCSARQGNLREIDFYTADYQDGKWGSWQNAGEELNLEVGVGELHFSMDGKRVYFHSLGENGYGEYDIWVSQQDENGWGEAQNLGAVINSAQYEGWPYLSPDGLELWFTKPSGMGYHGPALYRSILANGEWQTPVEMVSNFAGEPTLDAEGNLYFTHHFFKDGVMLEADIYVAYRN